MKQFTDPDLFLSNKTAKALFHSCAETLPVIDFRSAVSAKELSQDRHYTNISEVFLAGDTEKQRAMRNCGVDERFITGDASDFEKFSAFAAVLPKLLGNSVYSLSHLQLRRYFDCSLPLSVRTAEEIWKLAAEKLSDDTMSSRQLLRIAGVESVCTVTDAADTLSPFVTAPDKAYAPLLPAFSPAHVLLPSDRTYPSYIRTLSEAAGTEISTLTDLKDALVRRIDSFHALGCRTAVHEAHDLFRFDCAATDSDLDTIFRKALNHGASVSEAETNRFQTGMCRFLGNMYLSKGWVMQLYTGILRDVNRKILRSHGSGSGYDCVDNGNTTVELARLLDHLYHCESLPKTLLCSADPTAIARLAALTGAFQHHDERIAPTVRLGCGWEFCNAPEIIRRQLENCSSMTCIGMLPGIAVGSASVLSFTRHELFRRILCDFIGEKVEQGEYPLNWEALFDLVSGICYTNAKTFFGI